MSAIFICVYKIGNSLFSIYFDIKSKVNLNENFQIPIHKNALHEFVNSYFFQPFFFSRSLVEAHFKHSRCCSFARHSLNWLYALLNWKRVFLSVLCLCQWNETGFIAIRNSFYTKKYTESLFSVHEFPINSVYNEQVSFRRRNMNTRTTSLFHRITSVMLCNFIL